MPRVAPQQDKWQINLTKNIKLKYWNIYTKIQNNYKVQTAGFYKTQHR